MVDGADGSLRRASPSTYNVHTIMAERDSSPIQHEFGVGCLRLTPRCRGRDVRPQPSPGRELITVKQMIPDVEATDISDPTLMQLFAIIHTAIQPQSRGRRKSAEQQPKPISIRPDGYVDFRTTGRDIRLRIQIDPNHRRTSPAGDGWRILIDAVARGDR